MNNNLSFFECVVKHVLVIIGFLIGLGVVLSAKGDSIPYSLPEKEILDAYKTVQNGNTNEILPSLTNVSDFYRGWSVLQPQILSILLLSRSPNKREEA